jgi:parallel beta-helix repeat protein/predicted outer membrane repeat protein
MVTFLKKIILIQVYILFAIMSYSQTVISSANNNNNITRSERWEDSWYIIEDPVTIDAGADLTIDPTAEGSSILIEIEPGIYFQVNGEIHASGTSSLSITFTATDQNQGWSGIRFDGVSSSYYSEFEYCILEYGKKPTWTGTCNGNPQYCGGTIYVLDYSNVDIQNCIFRYNRATFGGAVFTSAHNSDMGITIHNYNNFYQNSAVLGGAVMIRSYPGTAINSTSIYDYNTFYQNDADACAGAVVVGHGSDGSIIDNTFEENVSNGYGNNGLNYYGGGAIKVGISDVTIQGNTFTENEAYYSVTNSGYGGAILLENNTLVTSPEITINNENEFEDNYSETAGGAIAAISTATNYATLLLEDNSLLTNISDGSGGGIYINNWTSTIDIEGNDIEANEAEDGAGIYLEDCTSATISSSNSISENIASANGGGMYLDNSYPTISGNTIDDNEAVNGAGIYATGLTTGGSSVSIASNTSISGNIASGNGGALCFISSPNANITSNTVGYSGAANYAANGAGIYIYSSNLTLTSNTISYNESTTNGGGMYVYNSTPGITYNAFTSNQANNGGGIYLSSSSISLGSTNTIISNTANYNGGGLFIDQYSSPTLSSLTFRGNNASSGGGIYINNIGFDLTGQTFVLNTATLGGAVFSNQISADISTNTFTSNSASNGGAIYCNTSSSPDIYSNTFTTNSATEGGALYLESASPTINNQISAQSATRGGAIYIANNSNPTFNSNSTIDYNTATDGGGIYCYNSSPILNDLTITYNEATNRGGGIFCEDATPDITNCDITRNSANYGGGIFLNNESDAYINHNNIYDVNDATYDGGGIYCMESDPEISENRIESNTANNGGGIYANTSSPYITINQTIAYNSVDNDGGGIYFYNCSGTFSDDVIGNLAGNNGGGIYMESCSLTVNSIDLLQNEAANHGGGIYLEDIPAYPYGIVNSSVYQNIANSDASGGGNGGGILVNGGEPYIAMNIIDENEATNGGGIALYNEAEAWVYANTIEDNEVSNNGGGIWCFDSDAEITYNGLTVGGITSNHADNNGGGIYFDRSNPYFLGNHVEENDADYDSDNSGDGGGIYFTWSTINCPSPLNIFSLNEFRSNNAENGGGICVYEDYSFTLDTFRFVNNLVAENNYANNLGGGIYLNGLLISPKFNSNTIADNSASSGGTEIHSTKSFGSGTFLNNIIWNSTTNSVVNSFLIFNNYQAFDYSDIKGCNSVSNNIDSDPLFHGSGNYRVNYSPMSLCIDAGATSYGGTSVLRTSIDLDNNNRILLSTIDMGCYEHDGTNWLIWWDEKFSSTENKVADNTISSSVDKIRIYPNPAIEHAVIEIELLQSQQLFVYVYNSAGKVVWDYAEHLDSGQHRIHWLLNDLSEGMYLVHIRGDQEIDFSKTILIN